MIYCHVLKRGPYRIALNYQLVPFDAPAPRGAKFLVGSRQVEPVGVAVWTDGSLLVADDGSNRIWRVSVKK